MYAGVRSGDITRAALRLVWPFDGIVKNLNLIGSLGHHKNMLFQSCAHDIQHCAYFLIQNAKYTCSIMYAVLLARRFIFVAWSPFLRPLLRDHVQTAPVWKTVAANL